MKKSKILIVEDNQDILSLLCEVLEEEYLVDKVADGVKALTKFKDFEPNLVILDLMLPGIMGESVLKTIRKTSKVPILVLTAVQDKQKIVELLTNGANDYLTKPFDIDELLARVKVQLRTEIGFSNDNFDKLLTYNEITIDVQTHNVTINDQKITLPKKEFEILKILIKSPHQVFEKEQLYEMVWGEPYLNAENTLNVHISNLRLKIGAILTNSEYVKSIWGIGIRLD